MTTKERILLESKAWREEKLSLDTGYFTRLDAKPTPRILWIASTDAKIPVQEMTNTEPGEVMLYRNIGIQIREDDKSLQAVLEEAVLNDHIKHIMLCAYSHCSGISHVIEGRETGPTLKNWLKDLNDLYEKHYDELRGLNDVDKEKMLNQINIRQQVINLGKMEVIRKAWERNDYPKIIGWYFDLTTGYLTEVFSLEKNHRLKQSADLMGKAGQ